MHARSFFSHIDHEKTKSLLTTVEWHSKLTDSLEKQIIQTHIASFLDLYQSYTEAQLGLPPGKSKKIWLTEMILSDLNDIKAGKIHLATISIEDSVAGFITCYPAAYRDTSKSGPQIIQEWRKNKMPAASLWQDAFRKDVYISLLAVKQTYDKNAKNKIKIGLGRQLIESVITKFPDATTLTLDTRLINVSGIGFYQHLGFSTAGKHTFGGSDPAHYTGLEKQLKQLI